VKFRRDDWYVADVPIEDARILVETHHYARGASKTRVYLHGLYDLLTDELKGLVWWLPPTRPACLSVNPHEPERVISLSRMVMAPDVPKNACSFLQARSIELIRKDGRFNTLVTYADEAQGHTGFVYRVSGWTYFGRTEKTLKWIDPATGRQVSLLATKSRTVAQMCDLGYVKAGRHAKHKFVRYLDKHLHRRYCEL
jgi:hypothetical protein